MPRAKALTPDETDERLAYALTAGWSTIACCRHAGKPFRYRQAAHDYVASKLADPAFRAKVEFYREMIERDEADLRSISQQVSCLNRDWLLARLRRIHAVAMGHEPAGIGDDGNEVYLPAPNLPAAIRALGEMAKLLRVAETPTEDDEDLARVLAEVREGRKAVN